MILKLAVSELYLFFATVILWTFVDEERKIARYLEMSIATLGVAFTITVISAIWAYLPE